MTKSSRRVVFLALLISISGAGRALHAAPKPKAKAPAAGGERLLRIAFQLRAEELESSGNFVVKEGNQGNYVAGGETPFEVGGAQGHKAVEYKKWATTVNCVPVGVLGKARKITAECQFEISGSLKPAAEFGARPVMTFQISTQFETELGRKIILVDEPAKHIEVQIDELAP